MSKKKVLVVDDDKSILEMIDVTMSSMGFEIETADSESGFRESIKRSKPDAIIMDVRLPGMDGIMLCRELRLSAETSHIPVIIITALTDKETLHDAMLFGAAGFLTKPFEISDLQKKVQECLNNREVKKGSGK